MPLIWSGGKHETSEKQKVSFNHVMPGNKAQDMKGNTMTVGYKLLEAGMNVPCRFRVSNSFIS